MANIFQALSLPKGGATQTLGPVRIACKYPADTTANNKRRRNIQLTDASGSSKMTIWGPAADTPLNDGGTYLIKGPVKINEYNGAISLTGEQLVFEPADGSAPTVSTGGPAIGQPAQAQSFGGASSKDQQIMRQNALAHATALVVASGVGTSVFDAQRTVLELAETFAKYSETGETGIPDLPSGEEDYIPQ